MLFQTFLLVIKYLFVVHMMKLCVELTTWYYVLRSIPFSVDDLSKSMEQIDISDIESPPLIRENSGFSFLLPRPDWHSIRQLSVTLSQRRDIKSQVNPISQMLSRDYGLLISDTSDTSQCT